MNHMSKQRRSARSHGRVLLGTVLMVSIGLLLSATSGFAAQAAKEGNKLVYKDAGQRIVVQAWGRDSLRVRITPDGGGQTSDWALDIPLEREAKIEISPTEATLRNGKISVRIHDTSTQGGRMQFFRHTGDKQIPILSECDDAAGSNNTGARTFKPVGDGLFSSELQFAAHDEERLYGMGENAANAPNKVNLKGCTIDLFQRHMKAVVPFVVSSEGYGFLWNNPSLGKVEFGKDRTRWISYGSKQLDYFITAGDSYADIMENYADATGHAPQFPYWASGFWQCKLRYQTQEEFLGVAREFKRRGLPLSVLVIDFWHWDIQGNWRLDPKCWPDPKAMVKEMDEMGYRIMISPWTLVDVKSENFAYMKEHGLFTGSIGGKKDTISGGVYQYDPTNPEAAKYLWSKWKRNYVDLGIRTFWLDPCDDLHEVQDYDQVLFHIGPARECHAWFPVAHQRNIFEGLHAAGEKEVVTICRNAWAGSQRYGACPAPHDINCTFEDLEIYMKVGLNVMMSGIPWWSCDTGFVSPDNKSPHFQELMTRWYQYGVFLPVFRTHACRSNNEPWNLGGKKTYGHIRASLLLRERLRPYLMEQMKLASQRGLPPMRPLFFDFMNDPKAATVEDEYMFGSDLLVVPVTKYGMRSREVYLPAGVEWTDAWTGKKIPGGQVITADAPIEHIPVYIRGDKPALLAHFRDLYEPPQAMPGLLEAESLKVQSVSRGRVEPQNMATFGNHWSDDSQLVWWGGLTNGDQLVLEVPVDKAGSYELELHLSKAEDYGIFCFQLDDGPESEAIDLFQPRLQPPMVFNLKPATLAAGKHRLTITYRGKNPQSRNSLIGIDCLELNAKEGGTAAGTDDNPAARYRTVIKSQDKAVFAKAALELRRWMEVRDPQRPAYHTMGPLGFTFDVNGPIYHDGKYHLFYLNDRISGGCHRGHMVSKDLVHWEDWPVAMWPDTPWDHEAVFSGNNVIDDKGIPTFIYTGNSSHPTAKGVMARSYDGMLTWQKKLVMDKPPYAGTPVHWDGQLWKDGGTWFQLCGGTHANGGAAVLWSSPDLENWTYRSRIYTTGKYGNFWELPYLLPFGEKSVLIIGVCPVRYWVGAYDKTSFVFKPDREEAEILDVSPHFYAPNPHMVDDKGPGGSQRRLMFGWVRGGQTPTQGVPYWDGNHSIPRVLTLEADNLVQDPIPELRLLRYAHLALKDRSIESSAPGLLKDFTGTALEIVASFDPKGATAKRFGVKLRMSKDGKEQTVVYYEPATGRVGVAGSVVDGEVSDKADFPAGQKVALHIFLDRSVVEVFAAGRVITKRTYSDPASQGLDVFSDGGSVNLEALDIWRMKSIWN